MQLSDEIVRGELAPGIALDEAGLAERFQVSRTPVREAIRLLAASGLVDVRPHRSAIVARPGRKQLLGMFEALCELEALCAGFAAERMSSVERTRLEKFHDSFGAVVRAGDTLRYYELNDEFHSAIYAATGNAYLEKLTIETRARIAPFSRAQFRNLGRLGKSYSEHDDIVQAILRGARKEAADAMRGHIQTVHNAYESYTRGM
jgi:DNA-binding GntR family transcriptional regulator